MASREKIQADFDLERFIDMFDEAMTSKDERVINALRQLMMMVILTKPESNEPITRYGPLRQMHEDMKNLNWRMGKMSEDMRDMQSEIKRINSTYHGERYQWAELDHLKQDLAKAMPQAANLYINKP